MTTSIFCCLINRPTMSGVIATRSSRAAISDGTLIFIQIRWEARKRACPLTRQVGEMLTRVEPTPGRTKRKSGDLARGVRHSPTYGLAERETVALDSPKKLTVLVPRDCPSAARQH